MSIEPFAGPFPSQRAASAGITPNMLRGPRFQRLAHSIYAPAAASIGLVERAAAALMVLPADAVLTGVTALHLHGVEVGEPLPVRAVTATRTQTRRVGIRLIRAQQLPPHRGRLAHPVAAWLNACAEVNLLEAVTAGDWLLHRRLTTLDVLRDSAARFAGPGCRMARRAAGLVA